MSRTERRRSALGAGLLAVLGLTAGLGAGLFLGMVVWPVSYVNTTIADLDVRHKEDYTVLVAGGYAVDRDLDKARARLELMEVPNIQQWMIDLTDRYVAEKRNEVDVQHLANLARAMGISPAMLPTALAALPSAATPIPALGATPSPSGLEFTVAQTRLLSFEENGGCAGRHSLLVAVLDAAGNRLDGALVCAYWALQAGDPAACRVSGPAQGQIGGWAEFPTFQGGEQLFIASDETGEVHLSSLTQPLGTGDVDIPLPWLVNAGYCSDEQDCRQKVASHTLCTEQKDHYSYVVVFQRTW